MLITIVLTSTTVSFRLCRHRACSAGERMTAVSESTIYVPDAATDAVTEILQNQPGEPSIVLVRETQGDGLRTCENWRETAKREKERVEEADAQG